MWSGPTSSCFTESQLHIRMKLNHTPAPFVLIRTPSLPLRAVANLRDASRTVKAVEDIGPFFGQIFRQALQVSRPQLLGENGAPERALIRSFLRMATRATPFGLHAACTLGYVGKTTTIELGAPDEAWVYRVLNSEGLIALEDIVAQKVLHERRGRLVVNPTACKRCNQYGYVRRLYPGYEWELINATPAINWIWSWNSGSQEELEQQLREEFKLRKDVVQQMIDKLLKNDFLRLDLQFLSMERLHDHRLSIHPGDNSNSTAQPLANATPLIDQCSIVHIQHFNPLLFEAEITQSFKLHDTKKPENAGIHAVLWRDAQTCTVGKQDLARLQKSVLALHQLGMGRTSKASESLFTQFTNRFGYESVRLMDVIEPDAGLESLLWGDVNEASSPPDNKPISAKSERHVRLLPIHEALLRHLNDSEVVLDDQYIQRNSVRHQKPLPDSFVIHAELWKLGSWIRPVLRLASGPPGTGLIARFASCWPQLESCFQAWCQYEDLTTSGMSLEVYHMPFPSIGNVATRPQCRRYALAVDGECQGLDLRSLEIFADNGELVIWSRELGKLTPRLTTAMVSNFGPTTSPVYKLFAMIEAQKVVGMLTWDWGPLRNAKRLPRISYRNVVIAPRQWRFLDRSFKADLKEHQAMGIPSLVMADTPKGPLAIDLKNHRCVTDLSKLVKKNGSIQVSELAPEGAVPLAKHENDTYITEILVPYSRTEISSTTLKETQRSKVTLRNAKGEDFLPGEGYLTVKIYGGAHQLEALILRAPILLISRLQKCTIQHWHFVRYGDPDTHVRFRLCGDFKDLQLGKLNDIFRDLRNEFGFSRIALDGHQPEIGRYGGRSLMLVAEQVFFLDSVAAVGVLASQPIQEQDSLRDCILVRITLRLIKSLGRDLNDCLNLCNHLLTHYGVPQAVGMIHQATRSALVGWAKSWMSVSLEDYLEPAVIRALDSRDHTAAMYSAKLRSDLNDETYRLLCAGSVVHMQVNRYSHSGERGSELVIYELIRRTLLAERAGMEG